MKKIILLLLICTISYAQIGIGTNSPQTSTILELSSTERGFLPPRMNEFQRDAITSPVAGLIIYCTDCGANGQMQVYNGATWTNTAGGTVDIALTTVASLDCANVVNSGTLLPNVAASGVSSTINYTGGNGKAYSTQSILSSGITGLTATLDAGSLVVGSGSITYTITGTPSGWGRATFTITLGGQTCLFHIDVGTLDRAFGQTIFGANNHNFVYLPVVAVDGKTWLNNNLGADYANVSHPSFNPNQQATSFTDQLAYGSLFQWGRPVDGHELINWINSTTGTAVNGSTTTRSTTGIPENNLFIYNTTDWRITSDSNLWQGVTGVHNPCPPGYRVPTSAELNAALIANNDLTNFTGLLKFTGPGYHFRTDALFYAVGNAGYYWSSTVSGTLTNRQSLVSNSSVNGLEVGRANGYSVRCIKD